jgi:hypothetical protein
MPASQQSRNGDVSREILRVVYLAGYPESCSTAGSLDIKLRNVYVPAMYLQDSPFASADPQGFGCKSLDTGIECSDNQLAS